MFMLLGPIFVLTANLNISSGGGNVKRITLNLENAFWHLCEKLNMAKSEAKVNG